ncbi:Uncharacterised protein [Vibrio cholerae]|nr:Uncharacterised protein [Vibrio cholerae]CSI32938.1 Uncharacterised protein [Vibrio cholerae]
MLDHQIRRRDARPHHRASSRVDALANKPLALLSFLSSLNPQIHPFTRYTSSCNALMCKF